MTERPFSLRSSPLAWVVGLITLIEIYCMFPFENKGDFSSIGQFLLNAMGSIAYIGKIFLVLCSLVAARTHGKRKLVIFLLVNSASPVLAMAMHYITHTNLALQRTLEAYLAGPKIVGLIPG